MIAQRDNWLAGVDSDQAAYLLDHTTHHKERRRQDRVVVGVPLPVVHPVYYVERGDGANTLRLKLAHRGAYASREATLSTFAGAWKPCWT